VLGGGGSVGGMPRFHQLSEVVAGGGAGDEEDNRRGGY
jgi:hypothetical protein